MHPSLRVNLQSQLVSREAQRPIQYSYIWTQGKMKSIQSKQRMQHGCITHYSGFKDALSFSPGEPTHPKQELIQSFDKLFLQLSPFFRAISHIHYSRNNVSPEGNLGVQFRIQRHYFPRAQVNQPGCQGGSPDIQSYSQHVSCRIRRVQGDDCIPN